MVMVRFCKRDTTDQGYHLFPERPSAAHQHGSLARQGAESECSATIVCYVEHSGRAEAGAGPCYAEAFGIRDPGAKSRLLRKLRQ